MPKSSTLVGGSKNQTSFCELVHRDPDLWKELYAQVLYLGAEVFDGLHKAEDDKKRDYINNNILKKTPNTRRQLIRSPMFNTCSKLCPMNMES